MRAMPEEDWERVGYYVALRRGELGYKRQENAAEAAEIGVTKWRQIEKGEGAISRPVIVSAVARALEWPVDMLRRIANGEDPPLGDTSLKPRVDAIEKELAEIRFEMESQGQRIDEVLRRLSVADRG